MRDIRTKESVLSYPKMNDNLVVRSSRIVRSVRKDVDDGDQQQEESSELKYLSTPRILIDDAIDAYNEKGKDAARKTYANFRQLRERKAAKEAGELIVPEPPAKPSKLKEFFQKNKYIQNIVSKIPEKVKKAAEKLKQYLKKAIEAMSTLINALMAGGWLATSLICIIGLIALLSGSVFGIFFSGEDSGTGISIQDAVREINEEYDTRISTIRNSVHYDHLEMTGTKGVWREVLAVYAVKTYTESNMEVITVDENKKQILESVFWDMNEINYHTETKTVIRYIEKPDEDGEIITEEIEEKVVYLYIRIEHKTLDEMISLYHFDASQVAYLNELLDESNNSLWSAVMYGTDTKDIVQVALAEVGNTGGHKYTSWYGFSGHVAWCACFVSWCADQCGYIEAGIIPKFASTKVGVVAFKNRGQWKSSSYEPSPGDIIFFDWDGDGAPNHVGIVERVDGGYVHTIEGNVYDVCVNKKWVISSPKILGYGKIEY